MARNCPGCGGTMEYDPGFDSLVCRSCGNIIDPKTLPDADDFYLNNETSDDTKNISDTLSEFEELTGEMYDCHVYVCSQCGADNLLPSIRAQQPSSGEEKAQERGGDSIRGICSSEKSRR